MPLPKRHHGHGQGGEWEIAPPRVNTRLSAVCCNQRGHDQVKPSILVMTGWVGLRAPQQFKKAGSGRSSINALPDSSGAAIPTTNSKPWASQPLTWASWSIFSALTPSKIPPVVVISPRNGMIIATDGAGAPGSTKQLEYADAKHQPARHLQFPEQVVADGAPAGYFGDRPHQQAPITAHRPSHALPWLVIGLEQIDAKLSRRARSESRK